MKRQTMEKQALSVVLIVALLATSFLQLHARVEFFSSGVNGGEDEPCCDRCICALTWPPQCQCFDVKSYCHSSCKNCVCTRSIPPQCRCLDIKQDKCDKLCTTTGVE
ncbi:Bowman-Birk type proteinase inhibitor-like [Magnolia sinica]|uniref:Bowman-Birk type proteinase inhibitor-like n=1 Tax=Magnolia sinica TaxID=86752 RepID=UPI0026596504|nr:Bowman-Birk type proteinase inhibitor-like [Magnolia sinica]